ncbi:MAG: SulP family inorganic anion transporter [Acidimicrobiales bacterium]|nr:SulP family inorganic anion transporter [Acidimicrobiales bacterium]
MTTAAGPAKRRFPILEGVLPIDRARVPKEVLAGVTLAALAIPEVMGYTQIAGMPVITGLYTILLPIMAFAVFGSSRHLVVGADSATAAVLAAGLAGMAATSSSEYVALAGLVALLAAGFLILARLVRLGFLADFLSRTVLVGFLTGVGVQVAAGQVGGMLGVPSGSGGTIEKLIGTLENVGDTSLTTVAVSASVIVVILGTKLVTKKVPGALIAVIGAIFLSWLLDLSAHGVATLGKVPGGLPSFGFPSGITWSDVTSLLGTAASIFILILAQSAATSRAYAAKRNEQLSENVDLVGLGVANVAAGLSGTFVVNGSPTKTEMVDSAGARTQLAQLTTGVIVLIVLLFLTAPLQYMPKAVLSSVVFLIGVQLIDLRGMRTILRVRPDEFVVAALTAVTVVVVGVEQAIILAIVASVIDHLRRSYHPSTAVLHPGTKDAWHSEPVTPDARSLPGLVVYRFSGTLYYANANHLLQDVTAFVEAAGEAAPLRWLCIDAAAMADIDYTGAETLKQVHASLQEHGIRLVLAEVIAPARAELARYGLTEMIGDDAFYDDVAEVAEAFGQQPAAG